VPSALVNVVISPDLPSNGTAHISPPFFSRVTPTCSSLPGLGRPPERRASKKEFEGFFHGDEFFSAEHVFHKIMPILPIKTAFGENLVISRMA